MLQHQSQEEPKNSLVAPLQTPLADSTAQAVEIPLELLEETRVSLRSKNKAVVNEAVNRLLAHGRQGMEILIQIIEEDKVKRKRRMRNSIIFYLSFVVILAAIMAVFHLKGLAGMFGSFSGIIGAASAATMAQKQGAIALAQIEDKRSVPYLLEALDYGDKDVKSSAETALKKLLPTLVFEDESRLHFTAEHHKILNRQLKSKDETFVLATLKALEQIGDETAVEPVGKLMESDRVSAEVKIAAQQCILFLKSNAERFRDARSLLRASSAIHIPNADLLRPATGGNATPEEELLRPVEGDSTS